MAGHEDRPSMMLVFFWGRGSQRAWEKGTFPFPQPQPLPPFSLAEQSGVVCCWSGEELVRGCCWLGEDGVGCCLPGKEDEEIDVVFREMKRGGCYWPGEEERGLPARRKRQMGGAFQSSIYHKKDRCASTSSRAVDFGGRTVVIVGKMTGERSSGSRMGQIKDAWCWVPGVFVVYWGQALRVALRRRSTTA